MIACGNCWGSIEILDSDSGKLIRTLKGHIDCLNAIAFSPDDKLIATNSKDYTFKLWTIDDSDVPDYL